MENKRQETHSLLTEKFVGAIAKWEGEGFTPEDTIATGLILFLRLGIVFSEDIKDTLKTIEDIMNASLADRNKGESE